jgi:hypothetical protein
VNGTHTLVRLEQVSDFFEKWEGSGEEAAAIKAEAELAARQATSA